ncbi:hypothetical protein HYT92_03780 [Candidatus Pacearchaeota archaeon]|nr:hypothetical protein [Candidatus Pacearchaeota archaeon]
MKRRKFQKFLKIAQLYGQVFIYLLTIILISIILIYGYSSIKNFRQKTDEVVIIKFQKDLKNAIESIANDYGSISRKELQLTDDATKVCFVESVDSFDKANPLSNTRLDEIVKDSIKSSDKNVFLMEKSIRSSFFAGKISVDRDVLCIKSSINKVTLRLEGKGDHAALSEWKQE